MKIVILYIFLVFSSASILQRQDRLSQTNLSKTILDSTYYWEWDVTRGYELRDKSRCIIKHDIDNNILSELDYKWDRVSKIMMYDKELDYSYDSKNNSTRIITKYWNENYRWEDRDDRTLKYNSKNNLINDKHIQWLIKDKIWTNAQITFVYDIDGNMTSKVIQDWDVTLKASFNSEKYVFTYDVKRNKLSELKQKWDKATSTWVNSIKQTFTYDIHNSLSKEFTKYWDNKTKKWINDLLETYTYDTNNKLLKRLLIIWNAKTQIWKKYIERTYTYNVSTNTTYEIEQHLTDFKDKLKNTNAYDSKKNILNYTQQRWDNTKNDWEDDEGVYQLRCTYDASNNKISEVTQYWGSRELSSKWLYKDSTHFYYSIIP